MCRTMLDAIHGLAMYSDMRCLFQAFAIPHILAVFISFSVCNDFSRMEICIRFPAHSHRKHRPNNQGLVLATWRARCTHFHSYAQSNHKGIENNAKHQMRFMHILELKSAQPRRHYNAFRTAIHNRYLSVHLHLT